MNKLFFVGIVLSSCIIFSGCTDIKLTVESDVETKHSAYHEFFDAHSDFYNINNSSLVKVNRKNQKKSYGTDFIGKKNYSVVYSLTYWDAFLAVFSFGLYVPVTVEHKLINAPVSNE